MRKIRHGLVSAIINTYASKSVRQLQELAMNNTRLEIPLIFSYDVIHGHKTVFPINLDMIFIEQSARTAAQDKYPLTVLIGYFHQWSLLHVIHVGDEYLNVLGKILG
jgi:hypothetical protein